MDILRDGQGEHPIRAGIWSKKVFLQLRRLIPAQIVFFLVFRRYELVVKACALGRDLDLWEKGDDTQAGENGP